MKRDMELVRKIMFRLEEIDGQEPFSSRDIVVQGYDPPTIGYHCSLLRDCGYILGEDSPVCGGSGGYFEQYISRLTSTGHDFIDAARSDTVWNKTVSIAKEKGISLTVDLTMQFLTAIGKSMMGI